MKKSSILCVLIVFTMIFSLFSIPAYSIPINSKYRIIDTKKALPDKMWTLTFNHDIDGSTVNTSNIYVIDQQGVKVEQNVHYNSGKVVYVDAPLNGYKYGEYTLYVENIRTLSTGKTVEPIKMVFTITPPEVFYEVKGIVYLDGNVSASQDKDEKGISNVNLVMKSKSDKTIYKATSDALGYYSFEKIPEGEYELIIDPSIGSIEDLKYYSQKPKGLGDNDCMPISEAMNILVNKNSQNNIGLMQGWMTNPFSKESHAVLYNPVDLDYRFGYYRDFRNIVIEGEDNISKAHGNPWGNENHQGIDWDAKEGTPILSIAPGVIVTADSDISNDVVTLVVKHEINNRIFIVNYGHISKIDGKVGDKVSRGQVIAYVGHTASPNKWNHLHLNFWEIPAKYADKADNNVFSYIRNIYPVVKADEQHDFREVPTVLDPFKDVSDSESENQWTIDNKPQYFNAEDNIDYEYYFEGCEVKNLDLASAASNQYKTLLGNADQIKQYLNNKTKVVLIRKNIIGVCGKDIVAIADKYIKPTYSWLGEQPALKMFYTGIEKDSIVVIAYVPGYIGVNGMGETLLGYKYQDLVEGVKANGEFSNVYSTEGITTIVFGASTLDGLDKLMSGFDFKKFTSQ